MEKNDKIYQTYVQILHEELIPAMGCTEPIAIAYAAAKARSVMGSMPQRVLVEASGSIIKNVKSVIVPNTDHMKGIEAAAAAGITAGDPEKKLECISEIGRHGQEEIRRFLENVPVEVQHMDTEHTFDLIVTVYKEEHYVRVRICDDHTNITLIEKDKEILFRRDKTGKKRQEKKAEKAERAENMEDEEGTESRADRALLDMEHIWEFVRSVDIEDIRPVISRQIEYNTAIAEEGMRGKYGANIGKVILKMNPGDIRAKAKAKAAAGSDARMDGCELPVVINSGSGNQGITCSVPVLVYAKELKKSEEEIYRALTLSNLLAIYQKCGIGCLSAYCGAVSAGAAAGAGIAYLCGGSYKDITHTVVNALAIASGVICDGAKASCAAKIAFSVEAGIMGYCMYQEGQQFYAGDGIVAKGIDPTIKNVGRLGKQGMKQTNEEIIKIMVGDTENRCM